MEQLAVVEKTIMERPNCPQLILAGIFSDVRFVTEPFAVVVR